MFNSFWACSIQHSSTVPFCSDTSSHRQQMQSPPEVSNLQATHSELSYQENNSPCSTGGRFGCRPAFSSGGALFTSRHVVQGEKGLLERILEENAPLLLERILSHTKKTKDVMSVTRLTTIQWTAPARNGKSLKAYWRGCVCGVVFDVQALCVADLMLQQSLSLTEGAFGLLEVSGVPFRWRTWMCVGWLVGYVVSVPWGPADLRAVPRLFEKRGYPLMS